MSETTQTPITHATTVTAALAAAGAEQTPPPANPTQTIAEMDAAKQSIFAKIESELAKIPNEIVAEVKTAFAALKAHL